MVEEQDDIPEDPFEKKRGGKDSALVTSNFNFRDNLLPTTGVMFSEAEKSGRDSYTFKQIGKGEAFDDITSMGS